MRGLVFVLIILLIWRLYILCICSKKKKNCGRRCCNPGLPTPPALSSTTSKPKLNPEADVLNELANPEEISLTPDSLNTDGVNVVSDTTSAQNYDNSNNTGTGALMQGMESMVNEVETPY